MALRPTIVCTALLLVAIGVVAQNPVVVSGRVIDADTNEPLAYAAISLLGKAIGTITNSNGSFDLRIVKPAPGDTLLISMIGYARLKIPLANTITSATFKLKPQAVMLDEVVVVSVDEIFKKIRARVKDNYPVSTYQFECFYREIKKQKGTYRSLLEAALVVEDKGYDRQKTPESYFVREVRGSSKFVNRYSNFWQEDNLLRETMGLNAVRHPASHPSVFGDFSYRMKGMGKVYERPVYVLASDTTHGEAWQRVIYVDTETYAIYRSEETIIRRSRAWKVDNNDTISMRLTRGTSTVDFRPVRGRLYLNYIRHDVEIEYFNPKTNGSFDHFAIINELVVTDVHDQGDLDVRQFVPMKNYALEKQVTPYNEAFWNNYNAIRQTPLETEIMKDLVKEATLKEQFIRSSKETESQKKRRPQK